MGKKERIIIGVSVLAVVLSLQPLAAATWEDGYVFVGISSGCYQVFQPDGTFVEQICDGLGGFTTGCAFDNAGNLWATNFTNDGIVQYDGDDPHSVLQFFPTLGLTGAADLSNESIVFDAAGDFYVGHPDGGDDIHKYSTAGTLLQEFDVAIDARGSDWLDLAANQCTMYYTGEGRTVKRYDVCIDTQLADFGTVPGAGNNFALRLLEPCDGSGGLLVADNNNIKRMAGDGSTFQTYDVPGEDTWFALNRDPDGTSFWSGDIVTGNIYRFDIETGAILAGPITTVPQSLFGICVRGELTCGQLQVTCSNPVVPSDLGQCAAAADCESIATCEDPLGGPTTLDCLPPGPYSGGMTDVDVTCTVNDPPRTEEATCTVTVEDVEPPQITCPPALTLECLADTSPANTGTATASDNCAVASVTFGDASIPGCGLTETITRTWTAVDDAGNETSCLQTIEVVDTTPPVVDPGADNEVCLWPPNHKYASLAAVTADVQILDACDLAPTISASHCTSDQCDEAPCPEHPGQNGDGSTVDDCIYDAASDLLMARSERAGTNPEGRTYTLGIVAVDACGNESDATGVFFVHVPHDQNPAMECIVP